MTVVASESLHPKALRALLRHQTDHASCDEQGIAMQSPTVDALDSIGEPEHLLSSDILECLRERPPVLSIKQAVFWNLREKGVRIVRCTGEIDAALCEGHFPGRPIVPLAALGLLAGQACCLAVAVRGQPPTAYCVAAASRVRIVGQAPVEPGVTIEAHAVVREARRGLRLGECLLLVGTKPVFRAQGVLVVPLPFQP